MGQCLKICEGTFCLKMADSIAILVQFFSILMLDQFSRRRRCALNRRINNKKINRYNIFSLKVITVLIWKITNIANFPQAGMTEKRLFLSFVERKVAESVQIC